MKNKIINLILVIAGIIILSNFIILTRLILNELVFPHKWEKIALLFLSTLGVIVTVVYIGLASGIYDYIKKKLSSTTDSPKGERLE